MTKRLDAELVFDWEIRHLFVNEAVLYVRDKLDNELVLASLSIVELCKRAVEFALLLLTTRLNGGDSPTRKWASYQGDLVHDAVTHRTGSLAHRLNRIAWTINENWAWVTLIQFSRMTIFQMSTSDSMCFYKYTKGVLVFYAVNKSFGKRVSIKN
ncbi:hypothetical protein CEXT_574441 [Caerostris extrusa]|uniref:Uncharacterized protein n=1 Tax=Caerostris extrusa TaxID=172846 RepID=A0AAV4XVW4_CAEEX|nr:hypothetical protein CEXT_574441 [Caerostris extrusa]